MSSRPESSEPTHAEKHARAQAKITTVVWLGDLPYFTRPDIVKGQDYFFATLIRVESLFVVICRWMQQLADEWLVRDDVFSRQFLSIVIFYGSPPDISIDDETRNLLQSWQSRYPLALLDEFDSQPVPGPYLLNDSQLWPARRLYNDTSDTLLTTIMPVENRLIYFAILGHKLIESSNFHKLRLEGEGYRILSVAIPSRLSRETSTTTPLAGTHILVKDIFDIEGPKTSVGNRGYFDLYPLRTKITHAIQRFVDAGAEILGKTKLSSFAAREEPTESTDLLTPFNPRGDGYQAPARNSSGSATAVASYD